MIPNAVVKLQRVAGPVGQMARVLPRVWLQHNLPSGQEAYQRGCLLLSPTDCVVEQWPGGDELKGMILGNRCLVQLWSSSGGWHPGPTIIEDPLDWKARPQLVIPSPLPDELLTYLHEGKLGGHVGWRYLSQYLYYSAYFTLWFICICCHLHTRSIR